MGARFAANRLRGLAADGLLSSWLGVRRGHPSRKLASFVRSSVTLETLNWDNAFRRETPRDQVTANVPRQVEAAAYSDAQPTPPRGTIGPPRLVVSSDNVAALLDLTPEELKRPDFVSYVAGEKPIPGAEPYAMCYGGHQFGQFAGQLGDGRAINLGEVVNTRNERFELQLKGSGKTPYSRFADGFAVLRSSAREFLASEAMAALGIPTTRALALVTSGDAVARDQFYDGHPQLELGAILCRVAPSHVRIGSFELPYARGDGVTLKALADFIIKRHMLEYNPLPAPDRYLALFREVTRRTARLFAQWQLVGFTHGVCNTDNMSILGLTIDYGPFAFLNEFDPSFTPNTSDTEGRYCFGAQPTVGAWNVARLGNALTPLIPVEAAQAIAESYAPVFRHAFWAEGMAAKLGLLDWRGEADQQMAMALMGLMSDDRADHTILFRSLSHVDVLSCDAGRAPHQLAALASAFAGPLPDDRVAAWSSWLSQYAARVLDDSGASPASPPGYNRRASMDAINPKYVLRNHLAHEAIQAAEHGDFEPMATLHNVLQRPFDEQSPERARIFAGRPPAWAADRGVCQLSCSS